MNIVIVGHIDHGKSTLIGRLLFDTNSLPETVIQEAKNASKDGEVEFAYLLDCLEEERQQNITIDTTQTFFKTEKRRYTIVDAPGHNEFLKNMVSGASTAEAAILMVDASRGLEEQTRRHAFILKLLGLKQLIVAINKLDAVNYSADHFAKLESDVKEFLEKVGLSAKAILPISAKLGENMLKPSPNMAWYKGPTLLQMLDSLEESSDLSEKPLRFPIQDSYEVDGERVYVGRVESGKLKVGSALQAFPANSAIKVKSIKIMDGIQSEALPGECVGVVLETDIQLKRGDVLCSGVAPRLSKSIELVVFSLSQNAMSVGDEGLLQCATQSHPCKIASIFEGVNSSTLEPMGEDSKSLDYSQVAKMRIELETPIVSEEFTNVSGLGRFVFTQDSEIRAAGIASS